MSNYTQTTSFTPKDSLPSGNPAKIIKGADFDAEFSAISAAVATKADSSSISNVNNTSDLNKPISTATQAALDAKQATLVSGTNIKTINSESVLGSGNLTIVGTPDFVLQSQGII
jgi:hypothetical protein